MNLREHQFDELVRQKLEGYSEPPDFNMLESIHTRKNRLLKWYGLYRILIIGSTIGLGLWGSYYAGSQMAVAEQRPAATEFVTGAGAPETGINPGSLAPLSSASIHTSGGSNLAASAVNNNNGSASGNRQNQVSNPSKSPSDQHTGNKTTSNKNNSKDLKPAAQQGRSGNNRTSQNDGKAAAAPKSARSGNMLKGNAATEQAAVSSKNAGTKAAQSGSKAGQQAASADRSSKKATAGADKTGSPAANKPAASQATEAGKDKQAANDNKDKPGKKNSDAVCQAKFDYYASYNGDVSFSNFSDAPLGASAVWEFGDGSASISNAPVHKYERSGIYLVTLHVKDQESGCEASFNKNVTVGLPGQKQPLRLKGIVKAGEDELDGAFVELLKYDEDKKGYEAISNVVSSREGIFEFKGIEAGKYMLRAYPTADAPLYSVTYWGNAKEADDAGEIVAFGNDAELSGYRIDLVYNGKQNGGGGSGANDQPRSILADNGNNPGKIVFILDQNNQVVASVNVDANGNFSAGNLGQGEFKILDPSTGKISNGMNASKGSISGNTASAFNSDETGADAKVVLSPNPAKSLVNFSVENAQEEIATVVVVNSNGVEVMRTQQSIGSDFNQSQLDITQLSPGVYYVIVYRGGKKVISSRLVKQLTMSE